MSANGCGDGLEAARLSLRLLAASDAELYCELYTDAATMRFIGAPLSRDRAERSFRKALQLTHRHPVEQLFLTVIEKATQQPVGICSVQQFDKQRRRAEAGIILKPAVRARGYSKEGLAVTITQAFALLPVNEVWVQISADHVVAERLVISIGFSRTGGAADRNASPARHIWSVQRESWCHYIAADNYEDSPAS